MQKKLNNFKIIKKCRLCGSKRIRQVFDFKLVPLGNNLQKTKSASLNSQRYPLKLMNCKDCNHFQLSISVNPQILFAKNYTYLSGITSTFKNHFNQYSQWIKKKCNLKNSSLVLDIGSNDGTCLKYFKKKKMRVLGIDPAKLPASLANKNGVNTINKFFNKKTSEMILNKFGYVDFVTSHNVLAHTENIREVFLSIFNILKLGGYFCFEIGYFREVVKKNLFDTIYHEHLDYHHAGPLVTFLEKIGFSIIDLSTNNIQGGTLRILLQKNKYVLRRSKKIKNFINKEKKFLKISHINKKLRYFKNSIVKFNKMLRNTKVKDKQIYAYGSPTKASLLLLISGLNEGFIKYSFEDNLLKCNKYIPGTDIKITSAKAIKKEGTKTIVVLAWNFAKEIILKLKKKKIKKVKIIIPLPTPKLINL